MIHYWTHYHVDVGLALGGYNYKIIVYLRVCTFVYKLMSRLIAKGVLEVIVCDKDVFAGAVKHPLASGLIVMFAVDSCLMHSVTCT